MNVSEEKDYLYVVWKSGENRKEYVIGNLSKGDAFEFRYCEEIYEAEKEGFTHFASFPQLDGVYYSKVLFPIFESKLPDRKRKDINNILKRYGLQEFDSYELLKKSGARLPIDSLYFVEPIIDINKPFMRKFYMAGARHYIGCNGTECDSTLKIVIGDNVNLQLELTNKYDKNAVKVINNDNQMLGYIPRYYSNEVSALIRDERKMNCQILSFDKNGKCDECVMLLLKVE